MAQMTREDKRLDEDAGRKVFWKKWGPYLSERQWGTVREDYSPDGDAWNYFPFDHASSRVYRWGEDGLAGLSDSGQNICLATALWNGKDPILKERLFGLNHNEGNHCEDVKELYYYLDNTPTHSYMKYLYKYPQAEFPYARLREENRKRSRTDREYELVDTGVFDQNRYFDVLIEYAKAGPEDILIRIQVSNRGGEEAPITVLPTLVPEHLVLRKDRPTPPAPSPLRKRGGCRPGSRTRRDGPLLFLLPRRRMGPLYGK